MAGSEWEKRERKKILSRVEAIPEAITEKNTTRILSVYDTRDRNFCTFEDVPPYSRIDGAQFRNFVMGLANLQSASIQRRDVRVDLVARNFAIVTGIDDWRIRQNDRESRGSSRFTIIFRKKRSWKVIHEHFTKIPEIRVMGGHPDEDLQRFAK